MSSRGRAASSTWRALTWNARHTSRQLSGSRCHSCGSISCFFRRCLQAPAAFCRRVLSMPPRRFPGTAYSAGPYWLPAVLPDVTHWGSRAWILFPAGSGAPDIDGKESPARGRSVIHRPLRLSGPLSAPEATAATRSAGSNSSTACRPAIGYNARRSGEARGGSRPPGSRYPRP